jgi:hypothetical protein
MKDGVVSRSMRLALRDRGKGMNSTSRSFFPPYMADERVTGFFREVRDQCWRQKRLPASSRVKGVVRSRLGRSGSTVDNFASDVLQDLLDHFRAVGEKRGVPGPGRVYSRWGRIVWLSDVSGPHDLRRDFAREGSGTPCGRSGEELRAAFGLSRCGGTVLVVR